MDSTWLRLKTSDGKVIDTPYKYLKISTLIRDLVLNDMDSTRKKNNRSIFVPVPLFGISGNALNNVIMFCELYHKHSFPKLPEPLVFDKFEKWVPYPYLGFAESLVYSSSKQNLFELIQASDYLDIEPLLHLTSALFAAIIRTTTFTEEDIITRATVSSMELEALAAEKHEVMRVFDIPPS